MVTRKQQLNDLWEAQKRRREELAKLAGRKRTTPAAASAQRETDTSAASGESASSKPARSDPPPAAPAFTSTPEPHTRAALLPLFLDDSTEASEPSSALVALADLYLHAAKHRSRHIALVWPASLKTLTLVHALATLARWRAGDKQGIRGLLFPVKTNAFHKLNHIHLERASVLRLARELVEVDPNPRVVRPMRDKDAFLFALSDGSLAQVPGEPFNPTVGELLPLFLAGPDFKEWVNCDARLLSLIRAKLIRRAHAKALGGNCAIIGNPQTAPDALFALDGRMSEAELRQACRALARLGPPEVVLVQATRAIRLQAPGWKGRLARFCLMLEDVFRDCVPGVVVVTDEPHAAYRLKDELWRQSDRRQGAARWRTPHEYGISGIPGTVGAEGLLPPGMQEPPHPLPREFDVHIVDADSAKVANRLARLANVAPGGREAARPLLDAAAFLSQVAALPCGVRHLSEYLAGPDVSQRTRAAFDWLEYLGAVHEFERNVGVGDDTRALHECLERGSQLFGNYSEATPFAHRLAGLAARAAAGKNHSVAIVFTSALYRRLAERFLSEYTQYPGGVAYADFSERVHLLPAARLEEHLASVQGTTLVFAGLNEDCLRLVLTDNRIAAHSVLLLTQRAGQFLRATLAPIVQNFPQFKRYKPRMESILRQLRDLPEDASVLSTGDYALPEFRIELSSDITNRDQNIDPDSWVLRFDSGAMQYRSSTSQVYVYDPTAREASEAGFRACEIRKLEAGDKVFVMSAELREMVEEVLREAGIPIQSDKTFEAALRSYHEQVKNRVAQRFAQDTLASKARAIRDAMIAQDPRLQAELPSPGTMRYWIDLDYSPKTPFEQLRPQAPLREAWFKTFAEVLGFSPLEAAFQWQRVIMAVRNSRRLDGRHVSDIYAYMLLQPESAMVHSNIKRQVLNQLFDKARENIATVESVAPVKESSS